jgi:hypothetical protein
MTERDACLEDLKAAREAFDKDNFAFQNILANRLLSNALFLLDDQKRFLMAGFFAKDLAIELLLVSATGKTAAIASAKTASTTYFDKLHSLVLSAGEFDFEAFWKNYEECSERLRKFHITDVEDHSYTRNKLFTKRAVDWLLHYLQGQKELLVDSRNQLLEGILNEIARIYSVHSAELRELQALAVLDYLQKVYASIRQGFTNSDGTIEAAVVRSEIHPMVDRVTSLFSGPWNEAALGEVNNLLLTLILRWREYFIRYGELRPPPGSAAEKGVELPEETKKRITEAITKSLERETRK